MFRRAIFLGNKRLSQKRITMAQVQMTVSMDSQRKAQIERYCALSGLTHNALFNEIMDMWERLVYRPQTEFIEKEKRRHKALEGFNAIKAKAQRGELPDLSMDEIIEEIKNARSEKRTEE